MSSPILPRIPKHIFNVIIAFVRGKIVRIRKIYRASTTTIFLVDHLHIPKINQCPLPKAANFYKINHLLYFLLHCKIHLVESRLDLATRSMFPHLRTRGKTYSLCTALPPPRQSFPSAPPLLEAPCKKQPFPAHRTLALSCKLPRPFYTTHLHQSIASFALRPSSRIPITLAIFCAASSKGTPSLTSCISLAFSASISAMKATLHAICSQ